MKERFEEILSKLLAASLVDTPTASEMMKDNNYEKRIIDYCIGLTNKIMSLTDSLQGTKTKPEARDVWWCWVMNEPGVIAFERNYPKCTVCNWIDDSSAESTSQAFRSEHTFCCHIEKPKR